MNDTTSNPLVPAADSAPAVPGRKPVVLVVVGIVVALFVLLTTSIGAFGTLALVGMITDMGDDVVNEIDDSTFMYRPLDKNDPLLLQREVHLIGDVGASSAARAIEGLRYLDAIVPGEPIDLYLTTWGGWPTYAFAIIDTMRLIDSPVNTIAIGMCNSAGAMILVGATGTRSATENVQIMIHVNDTESNDPFSSERISLDMTERLWQDRAALPEEWYPLTGERYYYLSAEQALEFGVIDAILAKEE